MKPMRNARWLLVVAGAVLVLASARAPWAVAAVVAFSSMLLFHEVAHLVAARAAGMRVHTFAIGFGPGLLSRQRGETEVVLKALPFGGFCRIQGMNALEEVPPEEEHRSYRAKSWRGRCAVALAGPASHVVAALVLLWCLNGPIGRPGTTPSLVVDSVPGVAGGANPARDAGLRPGDRVTAAAGRAVGTWEEVRQAVRARPTQPTELVVDRDGRPITLTAVPAAVPDPDAPGPGAATVGALGIAPAFPVERAGPVRALGLAGRDLARTARATGEAFVTLFSPSGVSSLARQVADAGSDDEGAEAEGVDDGRVVSPVGFVRIADQAGRSDVRDLVVLVVSANLFVALFNLVPLLPFDGGLVALATYERLRSRRGRRYQADVTRLLPLTATVVMAMAVLGLSAVWLDVVDPVADPFR